MHPASSCTSLRFASFSCIYLSSPKICGCARKRTRNLRPSCSCSCLPSPAQAARGTVCKSGFFRLLSRHQSRWAQCQMPMPSASSTSLRGAPTLPRQRPRCACLRSSPNHEYTLLAFLVSSLTHLIYLTLIPLLFVNILAAIFMLANS